MELFVFYFIWFIGFCLLALVGFLCYATYVLETFLSNLSEDEDAQELP